MDRRDFHTSSGRIAIFSAAAGATAAQASEPKPRDCAWICLGANVGVAHQLNLVTASDDSLRRWLADAFAAEGAAIDHAAGPDAPVRGEAGAMRRGGARYLIAGTDFFHHPADRWPEAAEVGALAAYARGFAAGVLRLSRR
jgi:hypothetical protein